MPSHHNIHFASYSGNPVQFCLLFQVILYSPVCLVVYPSLPVSEALPLPYKYLQLTVFDVLKIYPRPAAGLCLRIGCHAHLQGCVEIIYISVQITMYTFIVYWMCWFQRDAGQSPLALYCTHHHPYQPCLQCLPIRVTC